MTAHDESVRQTAVRETREEVGLDLDVNAAFLGYFRPFMTHTANMEVVPAVFLMKRVGRVVLNQEVSDFRWVPFDLFREPRSKSSHRLTVDGRSGEVPAYLVGDYVVWGLTQRIIEALLSRSDRPKS